MQQLRSSSSSSSSFKMIGSSEANIVIFSNVTVRPMPGSASRTLSGSIGAHGSPYNAGDGCGLNLGGAGCAAPHALPLAVRLCIIGPVAAVGRHPAVLDVGAVKARWNGPEGAVFGEWIAMALTSATSSSLHDPPPITPSKHVEIAINGDATPLAILDDDAAAAVPVPVHCPRSRRCNVDAETYPVVLPLLLLLPPPPPLPMHLAVAAPR